MMVPTSTHILQTNSKTALGHKIWQAGLLRKSFPDLQSECTKGEKTHEIKYEIKAVISLSGNNTIFP